MTEAEAGFLQVYKVTLFVAVVGRLAAAIAT